MTIPMIVDDVVEKARFRSLKLNPSKAADISRRFPKLSIVSPSGKNSRVATKLWHLWSPNPGWITLCGVPMTEDHHIYGGKRSRLCWHCYLTAVHNARRR